MSFVVVKPVKRLDPIPGSVMTPSNGLGRTVFMSSDILDSFRIRVGQRLSPQR